MKIPDYSPSNVDVVQETGGLTPRRVDDKSMVDSQSDIPTLDFTDLSSVTKVLAKAGEKDAARVEELRRQVANGTYKVDSGELAQKLVDSMCEES
jgi:flagellar biosynthesis anti-sigma factor FlgM